MGDYAKAWSPNLLPKDSLPKEKKWDQCQSVHTWDTLADLEVQLILNNLCFGTRSTEAGVTPEWDSILPGIMKSVTNEFNQVRTKVDKMLEPTAKEAPPRARKSANPTAQRKIEDLGGELDHDIQEIDDKIAEGQ